ncbi:MAG TPA: hypothetical protein PKZ84_19215 [Anaerolineae bacterium]|nr:hypothetical protein [Anaerolineae bacterium]HQI87004.1 hypothetical protein [Anaerolineae bacterium]
MKRPDTRPAFSTVELMAAHRFLASRVAVMMGRKFEEGDWAYVYCAAKGISNEGWSNLHIDVMHGALGVEHKTQDRARWGKAVRRSRLAQQ